MTGRQKILQVLKVIKRESEINPNPKLVIFKFTRGIVGQGILTEDQERRILIKLEMKKVIEILVPIGRNEYEKSILEVFKNGLDFIQSTDFESVPIKILKPFYFKYFWYSFTSFNENWWNYVNPFWLLWKFLRMSIYLIEFLWKKSKLITIGIGLFGLLAIDYSLAWKNLKFVLNLFNI